MDRRGAAKTIDGNRRAWHLVRVKRWLALALLGGVTSGACSGAVADTRDGAEVFAKTCTTCHGPTGKPEEAMVARLGVKDLTAPDERAKLTPDFVANQVRVGSKNKLMPGFTGALSDEQIAAVAAYVASPEFLKR